MDERRVERLASDTQVYTVKQGVRRAHTCGNISRLGCMIGDEGLYATTGDEFEIELAAGVIVPARVIWARNGQLGVAFKREIDRATVRLLAERGTGGYRDVSLRDRVGRLFPDRGVQAA